MSITNPRQTFLNPAIPFAGTILGGLLPGEMVLIQGSVPSNADRFQIDFQCGSSVKPRADVAFHFNPRFKRSQGIVCNTLQNERWGKEQIQSQTPFKPGSAFEVFVLVQTQSFKVAVNGAHCLEYIHRLDLDRVDTLAISGMVKVEVVGIIPSNASTAPVPASLRTEATEPNSLLPSSGDLSLPFRGQLVKGLSVGHTITIKGKTNVSNFGVNLRVGGGTDIALHLNPRFKEGKFIRNSYLSDCWGPEEKDLPGAFPFKTGEYFEMIILCEAHAFKVAVNGVHQLEYKHRVQDLKKINELEAMGDVQLLDVKLL